MPRTSDEIAADAALTAAIDGVHRAYHGDDVEGVLTTYVVVAQRQRWDEDGEVIEQVITNTGDTHITYSQLLGLLEYAKARTRKQILDDEDVA